MQGLRLAIRAVWASPVVTAYCLEDAEPYLIPTTIESGPTSGARRVVENPASFIQAAQSAPV
jgi:hypothetical protein